MLQRKRQNSLSVFLCHAQCKRSKIISVKVRVCPKPKIK